MDMELSSAEPTPVEYDDSSMSPPTARPFVHEYDGTLTLQFEIGAVQSKMHVDVPHQLMLGYTRSIMGFLLFKQRPRHIGMIGLGGGSLQKYCHRYLPHTRISVAEISPEVIALRDHFYIPRDDHRFTIFCEDGADFVARHKDEFDVLIVDGFDIGGQPAQLCSERFYQDCYNALAPDGILVVNLCDCPFKTLIARISRSFAEQVIVVDPEDGENKIAFAGKGGILSQSEEQFARNRRYVDQHHAISFGHTLRQLETRREA
ncbi:MAG TPA: fused MFS/spermidine synthase [Acidisarcina sp.]|nr:fused MFS/spermidine synthase [Acidisarcina sp.]